MLKKFMIEREIPGVGGLGPADLGGAAVTSNAALAKVNAQRHRIQWQYSYVAGDKTFCVYLAESEDAVYEHARLSGFPATKVTELLRVFDPSTERQANLAERAA